MAYNTERLDYLVALKKNRSHKITKGEAAEFVSEWTNFVDHEGGFTEKAEEYLYEGIVFAGAKPFIMWVLASEDQFTALDALFKGQLFGKDSATTFRLLVSALAQLLQEELVDRNIICPIIKRIPNYSKNKDKKIIGDGHRILLKYFISEIDPKTQFPPLAELTIKEIFIKEFVELLDELLSRFDKETIVKEKCAITRIKEWLHPVPIELPTEETPIVFEGSASDGHESIDPPTGNESKKTVDQLLQSLNQAVSAVEIVRKLLRSYEEMVFSLQETERMLRRENATLSSQNLNLSQQEKELREGINAYRNQVYLLEAKVSEMSTQNQALMEEIAKREEEISERSQMMQALSRDRSKQSEELVHRLASKLRVEYRDFKDAETLEMNCDLGENMREQVKNIFSILIKSGIPLD